MISDIAVAAVVFIALILAYAVAWRLIGKDQA